MCVFNLHDVDIDVSSYDGIHPHKILSHHEAVKKEGKYLEDLPEKQHHFTPLILSVDRVIWGLDKGSN